MKAKVKHHALQGRRNFLLCSLALEGRGLG